LDLLQKSKDLHRWGKGTLWGKKEGWEKFPKLGTSNARGGRKKTSFLLFMEEKQL